MVPADSGRVSRARSYSGSCPGRRRTFAYGAFTLYGDGFHRLPLARHFVTPRPPCGTIKTGPTTPVRQRPQAIAPNSVWAVPVSLATTQGIEFLSFPPATKMFQFAGLPPPTLCVQVGVPAHYHGWVSPFGNPRIKAWSAAPRGLSQPPTSFIGSWRQGIHRVPLVS